MRMATALGSGLKLVGMAVRAAGQRPAWVFDTTLALLITALAIPVTVFAASAQVGYRPMDWLGYALTVSACVALAVRRRWPDATYVACLALGLTYLGLDYAHGPAQFPVVVALYTLAMARPRRRAILAALVATAALALVGGLTDPHGWANTATIGAPGWTAAAIALGWAVANRRAYIAEIRDRAQRAERTRAEETRRAVDAERLRIARELHDVISHTMSMIYLQAGAAAHVIADQPQEAARALATIKTASKEGLRELRAILNVLRQADEADPNHPAPGLGQLDVLVSTANAAALATTVSISGDPTPLPPTIDLASYRIIQESLTNVLRHAGPTTVRISVCYQDDSLVIQVDDHGDGAAQEKYPEGARAGITGMRERAVALGGCLEAGPRADGGFRVRAQLPLTDERVLQ
jgi:signal transduction histidine kinase